MRSVTKFHQSICIGLLLGSVSWGLATWESVCSADLLPESAPFPLDNPMTKSKIALGKKLFFDARLSKEGRTSCFTCHNVMLGGEDGHAFSIKPDGNKSGRSVSTVWNAAFLSSYFWYGQAASLEEQAEGPLEEMGLGNLDVIAQHVAQIPGYQRDFKNVFGDSDAITLKNITKAIAAYERTLITPNGAYDRFMEGDSSALSPAARRGLKAFNALGCVSCHSGVNFAGPFLPAGQPWLKRFPVFEDEEIESKYHFEKDLGRFNATGKEEDKHVFRVPTLRNIALTAPYFHNGAVVQLEEAVRVMAKLQLNQVLTDSETDDIVAFLKSLSGKIPRQTMPVLPPLSGRTLD
jgi:cytochrome c peroxidase